MIKDYWYKENISQHFPPKSPLMFYKQFVVLNNEFSYRC